MHKLKEYDTTGLYLRPDLSIDERAKRHSGNPSSSNPQPPTWVAIILKLPLFPLILVPLTVLLAP